MHADFSFSYLRFAEAASFDKKELRRSCTLGTVVHKAKIITKILDFFLIFSKKVFSP
jgi:hypothetical protein